MRNKLYTVLSCLAGITLTALLIWALGEIVRPLDTDDALDAIDGFHSLPENSVEVIGYGSSHMWRGLDMVEMYDAYGIGGYNYGCNWQHINTTALFVKDSLRSQSPKVAVIDTYLAGDPLVDVDMDGEIYYTRRIRGIEEKWDYLRQCFGSDKERYLSYFVPLAAFHENWQTITEVNFRRAGSWDYIVRRMGFINSDGVCPVQIPDSSVFPQKEFSPEARKALDDIVRSCRDAGVEILFVTIPWEGEFAYGDAMARYAEEMDCDYLNLFEVLQEMGIDGNTDFSDPGHLNGSGAKKVADYLGAYIAKNYDVTDMRTGRGNLWSR